MSVSKPYIGMQNVSFAYGKDFRFENISFSVKQGECSFFIGPNGAGKTTLLKLLRRACLSFSGNVFVCGDDVKNMKREEIARRVAVVAQEEHFGFPFTVEEVVTMGRFAHSSSSFFETADDVDVAENAMRLAGVIHLRKRLIDTLSGGERRRVEIARAVCQNARVLFLDEPTVFLDPKQQRDFFRMLMSLKNERDLTLVIISHDLEFVRKYADSVYLVKSGTVSMVSEHKDILNDECVETLY